VREKGYESWNRQDAPTQGNFGLFVRRRRNKEDEDDSYYPPLFALLFHLLFFVGGLSFLVIMMNVISRTL
jgi:hypothetical protein